MKSVEFLQEQRQIDEYIAIMQDAVRAMEASQGRCDNSPPNSPTHNNPGSTKINKALMAMLSGPIQATLFDEVESMTTVLRQCV